jgi:hypothetical protein
MKNQPQTTIEIPKLSNKSMFTKNQTNYDANHSEFYGPCACCGKGIKEPKFFIKSIWGGDMYPANDQNEYDDAWEMPVGNECIKKIPVEYRLIKGA